MPYIKQEDRKEFEEDLNNISKNICSKGDLTYCFYKLCCNFVNMRKLNYETLSTTTSCLEDAKLEFYRRKIAPYEDKKIIENGDI